MINPPRAHKPARALIFDLFGVVVSFDEASVYTRLASHCREPAVALPALQGLVSTPALITGQLSLEQLHHRLVTQLGLTLAFAEFQKNWLIPYTAPMPGMADLLRTLAGRYRLVMLSNVDRDYLQQLRSQHAELGYFAQQLVSCELGFAKPSEAAFRAAIVAAQAPPEACYFVDDKAENIEAAAKLGLRGHVFTDTHALKIALLKQGITWDQAPC